MITLKVTDLTAADREIQNTILNELTSKLEALIRVSAGQFAGVSQDEAFFAYLDQRFTKSTQRFFLAVAQIAHSPRFEAAPRKILITRLERSCKEVVQEYD